ncbi:hypothetical protein ANANG_G00046170 [Anguilla anguilla]|uniref:Uncharacterized protein n=1 Tax=Anguilla anguilla TaxID=7936 RepID=A0A9D3MWS3_ANGAN|nr:hypothetical protein ANANG_G00046170 [Anguilla anguilla]
MEVYTRLFSRQLALGELIAIAQESATHYLVKNTIRTFKELGVLKESREKKVTLLEGTNVMLGTQQVSFAVSKK